MKGEIAFESVGFAYDMAAADGPPALGGVDFTARRGETVALVGPSGAGKSTVINLLPRFFDVTAGRISIDGTDIAAVTLDSLRRNVWRWSGRMRCCSMTALPRISLLAGRTPRVTRSWPRRAPRRRMTSSWRSMAATRRRSGRWATGFPAGQRQRISIARAMLKDAPILLLDEATAALDAESEQQVQAALARLQAGRTTLVVAHRLSTIRDADQILVMEGGGIAERGTHDELLARLRDSMQGLSACSRSKAKLACQSAAIRGGGCCLSPHRPSLCLETPCHLVRVVDVVDPVEECHALILIWHVGLKKRVQQAGLRLFHMAIFPGKLQRGFPGRFLFDDKKIQRRHQPGAVGPRLAMHHGRKLGFGEQIPRSVEHGLVGCRT